jgi:hypothetical protein
MRIPCSFLATVLQPTRPTLCHLEMRSMTLLGGSGSLVAAFQEHPSLEGVILDRLHAAAEDFSWDGIYFSLRTCSKLKNIGIGGRREMMLSASLKASSLEFWKMPSLQHLVFWTPPLDSLIDPVCEALQQQTSLRGLVVPFCMTKEDTEAAVHSLGKMLKTNTSLVQLDVLTLFPECFPPLLLALQSHDRTLETLELRYMRHTADTPFSQSLLAKAEDAAKECDPNSCKFLLVSFGYETLRNRPK